MESFACCSVGRKRVCRISQVNEKRTWWLLGTDEKKDFIVAMRESKARGMEETRAGRGNGTLNMASRLNWARREEVGGEKRRDRREGSKRKDQEPGVEDQGMRGQRGPRECAMQLKWQGYRGKRGWVKGSEAEFLWDLTADALCVFTHSPYLFTLLQLAWLWLPDCNLPSV